MKLTKRQLRILIEQYVADAEGNVTPPQQYSTDINELLGQAKVGEILLNIYHDAFLNIANEQYSIYKSNISGLDPGKEQGISTLLQSDDRETFVQGFEIASTLELFNDDYESISNAMKDQMLNDQRLQVIISEMNKYLDNPKIMASLIYVDDKAYKPDEFLKIIIDYMTGYDGELKTNRYPKGLARGIKLLGLGPDSNLLTQHIFKPLGLQHLITGKQEKYPYESGFNGSTGLYPFDSGLQRYDLLYGPFSGAESITIGYPASREGKEEYGLAQSSQRVIMLYCNIYCGAEDPYGDTQQYYDNDLGPLISDFGLNFVEYGDGCVIMGDKKMFDEAVADVNSRHKRYSWFTEIKDNYEELVGAFLFEADDSYSGGGFNAPCSGTIGNYEEYYFPGYEREAKADVYDLLSSFNDITARIVMDLEETDKELTERVIDILVKHIGDADSYPDWDNERLFPLLIAALSADSNEGLDGFYKELSDNVTYGLGEVLENLISDLQG